MSQEIDSKLTIQIWAQALTAAGTACGTGATHYIDCLGFEKAKFHLYGTTTAANTSGMLKIRDNDVTLSGSFVDVTGLVGGTDSTDGFTIGVGSTTLTLDTLDVDLRGKKRYLKLCVEPSVAMTTYIFADLFVGDESPRTATKGGVTTYARG